MKKCNHCGKEYPDDATVCERDAQPLDDPTVPIPPLIPQSLEQSKPSKLLNPWLIGIICGVVGAMLFSPANFGLVHSEANFDVYEFDKNGNPTTSFNLATRLPLFILFGGLGLGTAFLLNLLRKASKK